MHNIACDDDGLVYVADRENHRVQVFDGSGKYQTEWRNMMRPCGLDMTRGKSPLAIVGELGPETVATLTAGVPNSARGFRSCRLMATCWRGWQRMSWAKKPCSSSPRMASRSIPAAISTWPRSPTPTGRMLFGKKPDHELRSLQKLARMS